MSIDTHPDTKVKQEIFCILQDDYVRIISQQIASISELAKLIFIKSAVFWDN